MSARMLIKCLLATAGIAALFPAPVNGDTVPALWGVAEQHYQLYSFGYHREPIDTYTDFGLMQYWNDSNFKNGDRHLEAFSVGPAGVAYLAINRELGGFDDADLVSLDLDGVTIGGWRVLDFIGQFEPELDRQRDRVMGLSLNPAGGDVYALFQADGDRPSMGLWWLMK